MEIYASFPTDEKSAVEFLRNKKAINHLRALCETVEMQYIGGKLYDTQAIAYKFHLLVYLIENELSLAKYLWKRLPLELKNPNLANDQQDASKAEYYAKFRGHATEMQALWGIGQSLWREEFANVVRGISGYKWSNYLKPFIIELDKAHKQRMVQLVNQAYTSITMKELAESYLGGTLDSTTTKDIEKLISEQENWSLDSKDKNVIIIAHKKQQLPLDVNMLNDLTQYVCFMESQQSLEFDKMAPADKQ